MHRFTGKVVLAALMTLGISCTSIKDAEPQAPQVASVVTPQEAEALFKKEPLAQAAEYHAEKTRWRLFGVQLRDVRTAVFADVATWRTREVREGELLARNIRASGFTEDGVVLSFADNTVVPLLPGADVDVREVKHTFDSAVVYGGRGRYRIDEQTLKDVERRHGLGAQGERVSLQSTAYLRLTDVSPDGVLGKLGLKPHDLVVSPRTIDDISAQAREAGELQVLRQGALSSLRYEPK